MPRTVDTRGSVDPHRLLPEGWRPALITEVEEAISRAGNECWIVTFVLRDDDGRRCKIKRWYVNRPRPLWFLKQLLIAVGIPEEDLRRQFTFDEDDLVGARLEVLVGEEEYNGQLKNTIERVRASGEIPSTFNPPLCPRLCLRSSPSRSTTPLPGTQWVRL